MKKLRAAILGHGVIGKFAADHIADGAVPGCELAAVCLAVAGVQEDIWSRNIPWVTSLGVAKFSPDVILEVSTHDTVTPWGDPLKGVDFIR